MERTGERTQIFMDMLGANSSAAGITGPAFSFENCDRMTFVVAMDTAAAAATAISPTVQVVQSADVSLSTNASVAGLSTTIGAQTANTLTNVRKCLIDFGAGATSESLTINGYSFSMVAQSTLVSTVATALAYGSSVGSSANTGGAAVANSLSSVINASTLSYWMTATTGGGTTASLTLISKDTASTGITIVTTAASPIALTQLSQYAIFEVKAEDLNSTSKYVGISISTGVTAARYAVTTIKDGVRSLPTYQAAVAHKKST